MLSSDIIPLLQRMISSPSTQQSATAVLLNLSFLDEAKPIIGSSHVVPFLVQSLQSDSSSIKHDASHTLYNLSTHPPNIQPLSDAGVVGALLSLLTSNAQDEEGSAWTEKVLAVFFNIASTQAGKRDMATTQGLIACLATILDTGEPAEQEQVVACLVILCNGDEYCSHMVLQEGVIPALVSISASGSTKGREKAQKLLRLFREQRQREPSTYQQEQQEENGVECAAVSDLKPLCKPRAKKLGRTLSSIWKNRHFSVYQC